MFGFFKKLLGMPTEAEKKEAKAAEAPYKIEAPVAQTKVESQITDAVTAPAPAKKAPAKIKGTVNKSSNKTAGTKKPGRKPKAK